MHAALFAFRRPALFPDHYSWYVLVCALDIMLTATILAHLGGREVNLIALAVIELAGLWGLIGFKFFTAATVIGVCEYVGRREQALGRRIAVLAVAISAFPCVAAVAQIGAALAAGQLPAIGH